MKALTAESFRAFDREVRTPAAIADLSRASGLDSESLAAELDLYAEEAVHGVDLLAATSLAGKRVLEVGAGLGLLSAWLESNGIDVTPLEPGGPGFDHFPRVISALRKRLGLPADRLLDIGVNGLDPNVHGSYDVIFSVNVMEHVDDLPRAFGAIRSVMAPGAVALHHCPNYAVPYEPHYGLPLVPFWPNLTAHFAGVRAEPLWQSFNFITHRDVRRLARRNRQTVAFRSGEMAEAIGRLGTDPEFRARHPILHALSAGLGGNALTSLARGLPISLSTPMTFECRNVAPE